MRGVLQQFREGWQVWAVVFREVHGQGETWGRGRIPTGGEKKALESGMEEGDTGEHDK